MTCDGALARERPLDGFVGSPTRGLRAAVRVAKDRGVVYAHRVVDRREGVAAVPQVVDRFTVSLDTELLAAFDHHIASLGYENRSEAIRDLIRDELISEKKCGGDGPASVFVRPSAIIA